MRPTEARLAAIGGTRQMIADDEFALLTTLLVDCNVVPRTVMASALRSLADRLIRKAAGELLTDWQVHRGEVSERVRDLNWLATQIETPCPDR